MLPEAVGAHGISNRLTARAAPPWDAHPVPNPFADVFRSHAGPHA